MSEANRTVTASTKVSPQVAEFLDGRAEQLGSNRSELLRELVSHYQTACESGLACPHCKNEVEIDLSQ